MINAKKLRKTTEWERLEISSKKLEISREHFMQKDRNSMDLAEAEDIKKRWQEYTEEPCRVQSIRSQRVGQD